VHALSEKIEKRCDHRKVGQRNDYNLGHWTSGRVNPKTLSRKRRQIPFKIALTSGRFPLFFGQRCSIYESNYGDAGSGELSPRPRVTTRRARDADGRAFYRLADETRATVLVECTRCDWRAAFDRDELVASHGADRLMPDLLEHLARPGCARIGSSWDRCGVYYVEPLEADTPR
jgi:hypothetical protein